MEQELNTIIRNMHATISVLDERTQAILRQTEKTNGRVSKVEERVDGVETRQENLAVKVGAGVTVVATVLASFINRLFS